MVTVLDEDALVVTGEHRDLGHHSVEYGFHVRTGGGGYIDTVV